MKHAREDASKDCDAKLKARAMLNHNLDDKTGFDARKEDDMLIDVDTARIDARNIIEVLMMADAGKDAGRVEIDTKIDVMRIGIHI